LAEQAKNRSNIRYITFNGYTLNVKQWAEKLGLKPATLENRLQHLGWPIDKALTTPLLRAATRHGN
jgi:uncharacterized protein YjcR